MASLVWAWLLLWPWILIFVLAAFIAVALDPAVVWLDHRGLARRYGAPLIVMGIATMVIGFVALSATMLMGDAAELSTRIRSVASDTIQMFPANVQRAGSQLVPSPAAIASAGQRFVGGLAGVGVALVFTVYFLLDGERTYRWLLAFFPARSRDRAHATAECARDIGLAYVRGNGITSLLTAICTWIALVLLDVPAALLLAILAGLFDFIPVIGFLLSAAPAVLLASAVSPGTALAVAAFYVAFNLVENYYIQPVVYGREMNLSSLAVIGAFSWAAHSAACWARSSRCRSPPSTRKPSASGPRAARPERPRTNTNACRRCRKASASRSPVGSRYAHVPVAALLNSRSITRMLASAAHSCRTQRATRGLASSRGSVKAVTAPVPVPLRSIVSGTHRAAQGRPGSVLPRVRRRRFA